MGARGRGPSPLLLEQTVAPARQSIVFVPHLMEQFVTIWSESKTGVLAYTVRRSNDLSPCQTSIGTCVALPHPQL